MRASLAVTVAASLAPSSCRSEPPATLTPPGPWTPRRARVALRRTATAGNWRPTDPRHQHQLLDQPPRQRVPSEPVWLRQRFRELAGQQRLWRLLERQFGPLLQRVQQFRLGSAGPWSARSTSVPTVPRPWPCPRSISVSGRGRRWSPPLGRAGSAMPCIAIELLKVGQHECFAPPIAIRMVRRSGSQSPRSSTSRLAA